MPPPLSKCILYHAQARTHLMAQILRQSNWFTAGARSKIANGGKRFCSQSIKTTPYIVRMRLLDCQWKMNVVAEKISFWRTRVLTSYDIFCVLTKIRKRISLVLPELFMTRGENPRQKIISYSCLRSEYFLLAQLATTASSSANWTRALGEG